MMQKIMISIVKDFTRTPAGRYIVDGPFSGQKFREDFLVPALRTGNTIEIDLDGVLGFGSSFLEEAFGGLVREGFSANELRSKLKILTSLGTYNKRVWRYIDEADARALAS
jgi:hypothetical protein